MKKKSFDPEAQCEEYRKALEAIAAIKYAVAKYSHEDAQNMWLIAHLALGSSIRTENTNFAMMIADVVGGLDGEQDA